MPSFATRFLSHTCCQPLRYVPHSTCCKLAESRSTHGAHHNGPSQVAWRSGLSCPRPGPAGSPRFPDQADNLVRALVRPGAVPPTPRQRSRRHTPTDRAPAPWSARPRPAQLAISQQFLAVGGEPGDETVSAAGLCRRRAEVMGLDAARKISPAPRCCPRHRLLRRAPPAASCKSSSAAVPKNEAVAISTGGSAGSRACRECGNEPGQEDNSHPRLHDCKPFGHLACELAVLSPCNGLAPGWRRAAPGGSGLAPAGGRGTGLDARYRASGGRR